MNRKNNPFVSLAALLLAALILVLTCTGCADTAEATETADTKPAMITEETETETKAEPFGWSRFEVEYAGSGFPHVNAIYVLTDKQTGVQYLFVKDANGAGLTKLEE